MDREGVRNKDVLQLQQIIISLKSEIVKYQNEISTLKNKDYYSMVNSLEQEISQLNAEKKKLSMELTMMKKKFEQEIVELNNTIQTSENHRIKLISSIEALVGKLESVQNENKLLKKTIEKNKNEASNALTAEYIKSVEKLNQMLSPFIENHNERLTVILETTDLHHHLLKEIKDTNHNIQSHLENISKAELALSKQPFPPDELQKSLDLENQLESLLSLATSVETQLDEKLQMLNDLDDALYHLAEDIHLQKKEKL